MHMIMRPARQPRFDHHSFVGGVVVHDYVNIKSVWNLRVDLFQEVQKLNGSVALLAFSDHKS